ncbi:glycogen synthase kinase-3-like [Zophobas morio]|uniref:glycogen synthase kinase-3-like n=1 Tax=Zophobas morio TaxID=2755281 RepID=UPI003083CD48
MEHHLLKNVDAGIKKVKATSSAGQVAEIEYNEIKVAGVGSFGVVKQVKFTGRSEFFAIKSVLQNTKYRNRELQLVKELRHPNIIKMEYFFFTNVEDKIFLNLVMEYVPTTVANVCQFYLKKGEQMPLILSKLYIYQLFSSLAYLHSLGICHRDVKPQNLLVDLKTGILKLCDFGSAKLLVEGEPSISYICSRYYRAPELLFDANDYTTAVDNWSAGCVFGEMLVGRPLFAGETTVKQLLGITKILGTPTSEDMISMNPSYADFAGLEVRKGSWTEILKFVEIEEDTFEFLKSLLKYNPLKRLSAKMALESTFFSELFDPSTKLPCGNPIPELLQNNI